MVDAQSWNRYRYARNDPVNLVDALGLFYAGPPDPISPNPYAVVGAVAALSYLNNLFGSPYGPASFQRGAVGGQAWELLNRLWERWKDANPCERSAAASYPVAASRIIELREQADRWFSETTGGQGKDHTYENAVQHCYFSCMATIHLGLPIAKLFGDAHECNAEGEPENTEGSRHDLHNNSVGRNIGYNLGWQGTDEECLKRCMESTDLRWPLGNPLPDE
jgi:hypothetical protein